MRSFTLSATINAALDAGQQQRLGPYSSTCRQWLDLVAMH